MTFTLSRDEVFMYEMVIRFIADEKLSALFETYLKLTDVRGKERMRIFIGERALQLYHIRAPVIVKKFLENCIGCEIFGCASFVSRLTAFQCQTCCETAEQPLSQHIWLRHPPPQKDKKICGKVCCSLHIRKCCEKHDVRICDDCRKDKKCAKKYPRVI